MVKAFDPINVQAAHDDVYLVDSPLLVLTLQQAVVTTACWSAEAAGGESERCTAVTDAAEDLQQHQPPHQTLSLQLKHLALSL